MTDSRTVLEYYACLVCERLHHIEATYDNKGNLLAWIPVGSGTRRLPFPDQVVLVCAQHSGVEVAAALAKEMSEGDDHDHEHEHEHDEGDET
jgi:hypothetical protein